MIFTLNILIDLCLIYAIWVLSKQRTKTVFPVTHIYRVDKRFLGKLEKAQIRASIAEKMADRAFNMASTANLGVVALQRALAVPRLLNKAQVQSNQLAKNGVDKLFNTSGGFDWLKPILSDEELDILEEAEKLKNKTDMEDTN